MLLQDKGKPTAVRNANIMAARGMLTSIAAKNALRTLQRSRTPYEQLASQKKTFLNGSDGIFLVTGAQRHGQDGMSWILWAIQSSNLW